MYISSFSTYINADSTRKTQHTLIQKQLKTITK